MICSNCKQDKKIHAKGLCRTCYNKQRKLILREKGICVNCAKYKISNQSTWYCGKCLAKRKHEQNLKRLMKRLGIE